MNEQTSVINIHGDHEEILLRFAKHLGTSRIRRKIFNAVYGRGNRPRSKKQIMGAAGIRNTGNNAQQAQNELDHLAKHRLIVRIENSGLVGDGSRFLYQKAPDVRANKEQIIRYADNRRAADKVPTKRRPALMNAPSIIRRVTQQTLRKKKHLKVLYLVANPEQSNRLRVDPEVKQVQEAIRGSRFRDNVTVEYRPAADLESLVDGLNDHRPQIVHFSGHGDEGGLATDNGNVRNPSAGYLPFELLAEALKATDSPPEVIVLNSCKSIGAKKKVLNAAKIVVAMGKSVTDVAATAFAVRFYAAIAAGQSVRSAVDQGKVAIAAASINEVDTPELLCAPGVNPAKVILT